MTRPSRPRNMLRRSLLVATAVGGLMLASVPLASAATLPAAVTSPSAVIATPGTGVPIAGGLIDSVVGIITGTLYGISGATRAVACSIAPACPPLPARHTRHARH
jgi:hypothetical protein